MRTESATQRRAGIAGVILAAALGLAACGGGSGSDAKKSDSGLEQAITGSSGSPDLKSVQAREATARKRVQADPKRPGAYVDLIRAQLLVANTGANFDQTSSQYSAAGKAELRKAAGTWRAYQALDPPKSRDEAGIANQMTSVFGSLNDLPAALKASEIYAMDRGTTGAYQLLAQVARSAKNDQILQLAARKAVELAPKSQRAEVKSAMAELTG